MSEVGGRGGFQSQEDFEKLHGMGLGGGGEDERGFAVSALNLSYKKTKKQKKTIAL